MKDFVQLQKKQNQTFILVCINFVLFMILFAENNGVASSFLTEWPGKENENNRKWGQTFEENRVRSSFLTEFKGE